MRTQCIALIVFIELRTIYSKLKVHFHERTFAPYCLPYTLHFCTTYTMKHHVLDICRFHGD
jgi:hypothetical protein